MSDLADGLAHMTQKSFVLSFRLHRDIFWKSAVGVTIVSFLPIAVHLLLRQRHDTPLLKCDYIIWDIPLLTIHHCGYMLFKFQILEHVAFRFSWRDPGLGVGLNGRANRCWHQIWESNNNEWQVYIYIYIKVFFWRHVQLGKLKGICWL